jgi:hypothetical protein
VEENGRSGPPRRGKDGLYHLKGKISVVSGVLMESLLDNLGKILSGCNDRQVVLILPYPRYWTPCCQKHKVFYSEEDKQRLLRDLSKLRRAVISLAMRLKASKQVQVIHPLDTLQVRDNTESMLELMADPVHLMPGCYDMLAIEVKERMTSWRTGKRKAERAGGAEAAEPAHKWQRRDGGASGSGGRGHRGGQRGKWGW